MQNVIDKIEWMFAGLGGFLGWFFGGFDGFLYALVVFVVCDYFTGVLAAAIKHELSSEATRPRYQGAPGASFSAVVSTYPYRYSPSAFIRYCAIFAIKTTSR